MMQQVPWMQPIAVIAFTEQGCRLARFIADALIANGVVSSSDAVSVSGPARFAHAEGLVAYQSLRAWTDDAFSQAQALIFVGATGIAVRAIAPLVADKLSDPAVVCVDEMGRVAVPLLSGHVGQANRLARHVAQITKGTAAISTATDLNNVFAVDVWAKANNASLIERAVAKEISAALLSGETVGCVSAYPIADALPAGVVKAESGKLGFVMDIHDTACPFARTLHVVPRAVCVGVGCKRNTDTAALEDAVRAVLKDAHIWPQAVCAIASLDIKADEEALQALAATFKVPFETYTADELLAVTGTFEESDFVRETVGVGNVCERAACASAGEAGQLVVSKQTFDGITVALACRPVNLLPLTHLISADAAATTDAAAAAVTAATPATVETPAAATADAAIAVGSLPAVSLRDKPLLSIVGLGPGGKTTMTYDARAALEQSDLILGYTAYIKLIEQEFSHKELISTGMRKEVERCREALALAAQGKRVALVCSGDPGVFGMASLCYELAAEFEQVSMQVIPGVTAAMAGAALLGAPLAHDFAVISLSDLLTPWATIEARLRAAAQADFCICLYNPSSHKRADYLQRACNIVLEYRSPESACGIAQNIGRDKESGVVCTLDQLKAASVDMFSTVFIGNSQTKIIGAKLVTPRGYFQDAQAPTQKTSASATRDETALLNQRVYKDTVFVFGGTTEGRLLVEWLAHQNVCDVVASQVSAYGTSLLPDMPQVKTLTGRLDADAMRHLMESLPCVCVVDATHPYAQEASINIASAADALAVPLIKVLRSEDASCAEAAKQKMPAQGPKTHVVADAHEAAKVIAALPGNVLLTTGSKDLAAFMDEIPDAAQRVYARILPVEDALQNALELGVSVSHIIAMQGPFTQALNEALITSLDIGVLVTKASGARGGFAEKVAAAQACGIELVIIEPPSSDEGLSLEEAKRALAERLGCTL